MLSVGRRFIALFATLTTVAAASILAIGFAASPAAAKTCIKREWVGNHYECTVWSAGDPGDPPGDPGQPAPPTCDLAGAGGTDYADKNRTANFCIDDDVCFTIDHFAPLKMPAGDKPNEDSKARVTMCYDGIMGPPGVRRIFWSDDEEPSLLEQAQTAIGQIDLGTPRIQVSPAGRTLVNLDTWFWTTGQQRTATGSSAFGLVAIATFRSMSVDPGDGTGSFACGWTTSADEAKQSCHHEYRRASVRGPESVGGRPAYGVRVTAVYDLRFEMDGAPITVNGAPLTLDAPPAQAAVRVDEVQTRVTGVS
jgi:hypothetical protein